MMQTQCKLTITDIYVWYAAKKAVPVRTVLLKENLKPTPERPAIYIHFRNPHPMVPQVIDQIPIITVITTGAHNKA